MANSGFAPRSLTGLGTPAWRNLRGPSDGFTMIEVLVVMVLLAVLLVLTLPNFLAVNARRTLQGTAEQASGLMAKARYDAIRYAQDRTVAFDAAAGAWFIDLDGDRSLDPMERREGLVPLPNGVAVGGPAADPAPVTGFTDLGGGTRGAVFESTGSLESNGGAFRLRDTQGNYLEVRVTDPATARVVLRKWQDGAWREFGEGGSSWTWER